MVRYDIIINVGEVSNLTLTHSVQDVGDTEDDPLGRSLSEYSRIAVGRLELSVRNELLNISPIGGQGRDPSVDQRTYTTPPNYLNCLNISDSLRNCHGIV